MSQEFGGIKTVGGATGTTANITSGIGTTFTRVTGFDGLEPANGVGVNAGVDELEIRGEGTYFAFFQATFWSNLVNTTYLFSVMKNSTTQTDVRGEVLTTTGTVDNIAMGGFIEVDANDLYSVSVKLAAGSGGEITLKDAKFDMFRVS